MACGSCVLLISAVVVLQVILESQAQELERSTTVDGIQENLLNITFGPFAAADEPRTIPSMSRTMMFSLVGAGGGLIVILLIAAITIVSKKSKNNTATNRKEINTSQAAATERRQEGQVNACGDDNDTYIVVLPDNPLMSDNSRDAAGNPRRSMVYVNVPSSKTSPRLTPCSTQTPFNNSQTELRDDQVYVNVGDNGGNTEQIYVNCPPTGSKASSPALSPKGGAYFPRSVAGSPGGRSTHDGQYDIPSPPYAKAMKEGRIAAASPRKHEATEQKQQQQQHRNATSQKDKEPAAQKRPSSPETTIKNNRGRPPATPSPQENIYSPMYVEQNMKRGVFFPVSSSPTRSPSAPNLLAPNKKGSGSSLPSHLGYLPMAGSMGRMTTFQYARDHADSDELYMNQGFGSDNGTGCYDHDNDEIYANQGVILDEEELHPNKI